jgi:hypothetical protein
MPIIHRKVATHPAGDAPVTSADWNDAHVVTALRLPQHPPGAASARGIYAQPRDGLGFTSRDNAMIVPIHRCFRESTIRWAVEVPSDDGVGEVQTYNFAGNLTGTLSAPAVNPGGTFRETALRRNRAAVGFGTAAFINLNSTTAAAAALGGAFYTKFNIASEPAAARLQAGFRLVTSSDRPFNPAESTASFWGVFFQGSGLHFVCNDEVIRNVVPVPMTWSINTLYLVSVFVYPGGGTVVINVTDLQTRVSATQSFDTGVPSSDSMLLSGIALRNISSGSPSFDLCHFIQEAGY